MLLFTLSNHIKAYTSNGINITTTFTILNGSMMNHDKIFFLNITTVPHNIDINYYTVIVYENAFCGTIYTNNQC